MGCSLLLGDDLAGGAAAEPDATAEEGAAPTVEPIDRLLVEAGGAALRPKAARYFGGAALTRV